jgi:hypothetical protein
MEKKDLDKRVRALTTLTKDHEIPALATGFFDFEHPLPSVHACLHLFAFFYLITVFLITFNLFFFQDHQFLVSRPPLPERGPIQDVPVSATSEAPEAEDSQDGDDVEDLLEGTSLTTSPPPTLSEEPSLDRKRKRVEEFISLSTSISKAAVGEPSAPYEDEEIFDLLDS